MVSENTHKNKIFCENEKSLTIPRYSKFAIKAYFFGGKKMLLFHFANFTFFTFFKWILKILTKIRYSLEKISPLLFPAISNLQFKQVVRNF